jgi:hypothetical protein
MVTVSVDYADMLALTLPRNAGHFERVIVVTASRDNETQETALKFPNVEVFTTDVFWERGAIFNKGAAIERAFDQTSREGWFAVMDADTILPEVIQSVDWAVDCIHVPRRRMLRDPRQFTADLCWGSLHLSMENDFAGYCQIFHSDARPERPWYPVDWTWAAGCDSDFFLKWPESKRMRPPFEVIHLGEDGKNWAGRTTRFLSGEVPEGGEQKRQVTRQLIGKRNYRDQTLTRKERYKHERLGE